jgi:hypothetical protein
MTYFGALTVTLNNRLRTHRAKRCNIPCSRRTAPSSSVTVPIQDPQPNQIVDGIQPFVDNSVGRKTM